jgi:hypothetical protein
MVISHFFQKNYELDHNFNFSSNSFKLEFQHMLHLSTSGFLRMVFEHLFHPTFSEWILLVVSTLFSYYTRSHSTLNYMSPWNGLLLNLDQAFKWSSSHYIMGKHYIDSQVLFYAFNFMMHLQHISPYTN